MLDGDDLHIGHFCLANTPAPSRWRAIAGAGFRGVSVYWPELAERRAHGVSLADVKAELAAHGLRAVQMELLSIPFRAGTPAFLAQAREVVAGAAELGCSVVTAISFGLGIPFDDVTAGFDLLCGLCAERGLTCGVEFVPHLTSIADFATARRLLSAVNRPNAGLILDTLHFTRCGSDWAALEALDGREIALLQINDGPLVPVTEDYMEESSAFRLPPGQGEFDVARFLSVIAAKEGAPLLTVEVMNRELQAGDPARAAAILADGLRAELARSKEFGHAA